jgi:tRNA dimethylallyltransferase
LKIGLDLDRERLYRRIDQRVDDDREGTARGGEGLIDMSYSPEFKPMVSLGYKHMIHYLKKD